MRGGISLWLAYLCDELFDCFFGVSRELVDAAALSVSGVADIQAVLETFLELSAVILVAEVSREARDFHSLDAGELAERLPLSSALYDALNDHEGILFADSLAHEVSGVEDVAVNSVRNELLETLIVHAQRISSEGVGVRLADQRIRVNARS